MQLQPNTTLQGGKYSIERVLGQGGFGITYLAKRKVTVTDTIGKIETTIPVAIKEFFMKDLCNRDTDTSQVSVPSMGSRELVAKFQQKFIKEAQSISKFQHPHIINVLDVFEEMGTAYYVMEYISDGSLADYLKERGAFSETEALFYISQVADALRYIHSKGVNHLDVKPSNILRRIDNNAACAILIDFGLSKQYDSEGEQTSSTPIGKSVGYAPMEQYKAGGVSTFSPPTDIYALGATLYKLVTGNTPPHAQDVFDDGLPALPSALSNSVKTTIISAMQPNRRNRPQTIEEFLTLLSTSSESTEVTEYSKVIIEDTEYSKVAVENKPTPPKPPKKKKKTYTTAWIAGIIGFVAVVGLYFSIDRNVVPPIEPVVQEEQESGSIVNLLTQQEQTADSLANLLAQQNEQTAEEERKHEEQEEAAEQERKRKEQEAAERKRKEQEQAAQIETERQREEQAMLVQAEEERKRKEQEQAEKQKIFTADDYKKMGGPANVVIPDGVIRIEEFAFFKSSTLTSITIPNSVTFIGSQTFMDCDHLTSITIPNSVTFIGNGAFRYCDALSSVTLPISLTSIGEHVFKDCESLVSITIPNSVTSIKDQAFYGCSSLTSVTIPNSVTSIKDQAFYGCSSLTSVTIPNSVTSIGKEVFYRQRTPLFLKTACPTIRISQSSPIYDQVKKLYGRRNVKAY